MKKGTEVILKLLVSFLLIQLLGLYVGMQYVNRDISITENPEDVVNAAMMLAYVISGAIMMLLLIKFYKKRWIFLMLEGMVIFTASMLVANAFVDETIATIFALAMVAGRHVHNNFKIAATAMACAGVGALMGNSLGVIPASVFAIGLSVYDVIAVFGTKHMITMAKDFSQKDLAFSLKIGNKNKNTDGERTGVELGTGDMVVPIMLSVSIYANTLNLAKGIGAIIGATMGLMVVLLVVLKYRNYLPALPPIVTLCIIGGAIA